MLCIENPHLTSRKKGRTAGGPKRDQSLQRSLWSETEEKTRRVTSPIDEGVTQSGGLYFHWWFSHLLSVYEATSKSTDLH